MTLEEFREGLRSPDPDVRAYLIGKLMRQAKPDDVFTFVSAREIRELWPRLERYLGKTREFWTWLFEEWEARGGVSITVDTPQEILVNKLCTLLSRWEVRDLIDVRALLESGADLEGALTDAPRKDAGFRKAPTFRGAPHPSPHLPSPPVGVRAPGRGLQRSDVK